MQAFIDLVVEFLVARVHLVAETIHISCLKMEVQLPLLLIFRSLIIALIGFVPFKMGLGSGNSFSLDEVDNLIDGNIRKHFSYLFNAFNCFRLDFYLHAKPPSNKERRMSQKQDSCCLD